MGDAPERPSTRVLASLGQRAGEVAHDFDNSLTAIAAHATMIRSVTDDPEVLGHARAILRAARTASQVVERVRAMLRGGEQHQRVQVDLEALADEARLAVAARGDKRGVAVTRRREGHGAVVAGDPAELLQVVINLGNNAVDASPDGAEVVIVTADATVGAALLVEDRGAGVPEELRERVFEPFFTTKGSAGTGLGLALCRAIVERHQGALALDQRRGGGTIARVTLPLAGDDVPAPRLATSVAIRGVGLEARVLVVDDDDQTREALRVLLDAAGFEVTAVADGTSAITSFATRRPDVVVSDLELGEEDGGAVISQLLAIDRAVPVVLASGRDAPPDAPWVARVSAILRKPVSPVELVATIRRLASRRRAAMLAPDPRPDGP